MKFCQNSEFIWLRSWDVSHCPSCLHVFTCCACTYAHACKQTLLINLGYQFENRLKGSCLSNLFWLRYWSVFHGNTFSNKQTHWHTLDTTQLDYRFTNISTLFYLYLTNIIPISHPYITYISPLMRSYLSYISPSLPYQFLINIITHPYFTHVSPIYHPYLKYILPI